MCSVSVQEVLEDIIIEKVNAGEMFTAFDITLAGKRRGLTDRHRDVKHVTHDFFNNSGMGPQYTRTLMDVGAPEQAFVYHRTVDDPKSYGKPALKKHTNTTNVGSLWTPISTPSISPPVSMPGLSIHAPGTGLHGSNPLPINNPNPLAGVTLKTTARADDRLTVCIPAKALRVAGFNPGDEVVVVADNSMKMVLIVKDDKDAPNVFTKKSKYTVDYHGNVRITKHILECAGIQVTQKGDKLNVDGTKTAVKVSA